MKTKIFFTVGLSMVFISLISTSCRKNDEPEKYYDCHGEISVKVSGLFNENICFKSGAEYTYIENDSVDLSASGSRYGFHINITANDGTFTGTGTYDCGNGKPGFVELIIHDYDNEYYKSISGTITVSEIGQNNFKGSYNVKAKGYYNEQSVTLSGTFNYTGNK